MNDSPLVAYGDFNCPWSYLASRRLAALAVEGVSVDWRAVEHRRQPPDSGPDAAEARFQEVIVELERVNDALLPFERFPYSLAGFVPDTGAAVSAYGQAYALGRGSLAREVLFEGFWMHAVDLGDPELVLTVVGDALLDPGLPLHADAPPNPRTPGHWAAEWSALGGRALPVLVVPDRDRLFGAEAVEWLGCELLRREVDVTFMPDHDVSSAAAAVRASPAASLPAPLPGG